MSRMLAIAAIAEATTGLALAAAPSLAARFLLGSELGGAGLVVGRVAGLALIALGAVCWQGGRHAQASMLGYSTLVAIVLAWHGITENAGILLWPAVVLHVVFSCGILPTTLNSR